MQTSWVKIGIDGTRDMLRAGADDLGGTLMEETISRMAGSLLTAIGLPELITETLADYEALAIRLGRQPARVASLKRYLAEEGRRSPLFDVPARVRDIEAAFESLALQARA